MTWSSFLAIFDYITQGGYSFHQKPAAGHGKCRRLQTEPSVEASSEPVEPGETFETILKSRQTMRCNLIPIDWRHRGYSERNTLIEFHFRRLKSF